MSSVQHLRDFIRQRLTAAAEEIFTEVEKTIVRYEEDIKLLETCWKPRIKLNRTNAPKQHEDEEEEVLTDGQLCNQVMNLNQDQEPSEAPQDSDSSEELEHQLLKEEPEASLVKEEQQEVCCSQEGQSLDFTHIMTLQQIDFSEEEPKFEHLNSNNVSALENQDEAGSDSPAFGSQCRTVPNESCQCHVCGKTFHCKYNVLRHLRVHSGEKPFSCKICGKVFTQNSHVKEHMKRHTGDRPFSCETCGKSFPRRFNLKIHRKTHTRSKFIPCETCGKSFREKCYNRFHKQTHTCEQPYSCLKCNESFSSVSELNCHQRVHRALRDIQ
ncbi:zinc finger and SCAN domain-containing protein 2-like isoform X2 [Gambusia affinis]|uniref:zinc finger and SCAN domain-containing protein 2-like isoform X2 n=1 Tax=Gambusia affinis TaxID=33528 RepID=UPI001CDC262F|nr:zinc finger and SCAN domain-containing protein 2-like isoform X2 [Gambusia affinis]